MRATIVFVAWLTVFVEFSTIATSLATNTQPVSLGKLEPFWRYSVVVGKSLKRGYGLVEIPDYLLRSDFPYQKRPYPKEVPFADHLSVVRLLGVYDDISTEGIPDPGVHEGGMAYRDRDGKIHYRMNLLKGRLQPYLDCGYTNLTLVLDNVPWCFPEKPGLGTFGQSSPPRDPKEWYEFIKEVCKELVKIAGPEGARQFRFRVGTENNRRERFNGTQDEYLRHYDYTAAAVREVLSEAMIGPFNISGVSVRSIERVHNVNAFALAKHCFQHPNLTTGKIPTPFDWVAFSRYYHPGDDPEWHARVCREVWDEFERCVPQLKGASREIHEFGVAPFGEVSKGQFVSSEPGALGAALTCQMMWRLGEAGIHRLWHWKVYDSFDGRAGESMHLFTSQAWLLTVMDRMTGGDAYLFSPMDESPSGVNHLMAGSFKEGEALFIISAYNTNITSHASETVRFRIPAELLQLKGKTARFVQLTPQTSMHDRIRREFESAGLLKPDFVSRPDRLGSVHQMGKGRAAEILAGDHWQDFTRQWVESLTLKPLKEEIGRIERAANGVLVSVRLNAPEVLVIMVR